MTGIELSPARDSRDVSAACAHALVRFVLPELMSEGHS
jgi:hypothetical protein